MIKLKDKKTGNYLYLPTDASEFTLSDYLTMQEWAKSDQLLGVKLVADLLDVDISTALALSKIWAYNFDAYKISAEVAKFPEIATPAYVTLSERKVKVKDYGLMETAQRILMRDALTLAGNGDYAKAFPKVIAVGLAKEVYGKGWEEYLEEIEEEVLQMSAVEAVPLAYFFLRKLGGLKNDGKRLSSLQILRILMRKVGVWLNTVFGR